MPTSVRCSEACAVTAELRVTASTARRLKLSSPVLARGTAVLGGAGRTWLFVRMKASVRRKVLRSSKRRPVVARLSVAAVDAAGNSRRADKPVALRR